MIVPIDPVLKRLLARQLNSFDNRIKTQSMLLWRLKRRPSFGTSTCAAMKNAKQHINDPYIIEKYYQIILFSKRVIFNHSYALFMEKINSLVSHGYSN